MIRILMLGALTLAAACSRDGSASPPVAAPPAAAPATAAPPAVAPVALAPGETLATEMSWPIAGGRVTLGAIVRGDQVVVRAFTTAGAFDVTRPVDSGADSNELRLASGGAAVLFESRTLMARVQEVGALFAFDVARIEWDAAAGKPVVRETWSCDETERGDYCETPTWAQ